jgi:shikimate kinase
MKQIVFKKSNKLIFLIGMPGVGKSYWGGNLAHHLKVPFADLDAVIRTEQHKTIGEIFKEVGEDGFRKIEQATLRSTIDSLPDGGIISCGGGTPCFFDNMQQMKAAGVVIYMAADAQYLSQNLERSTDYRPLLYKENALQQQLGELLSVRESFYKQAHHILLVKDISLATFDKILNYE